MSAYARMQQFVTAAVQAEGRHTERLMKAPADG